MKDTMLAYLSSETGFIRAYGNRTLLIIFLCALTRTGEKPASASAFGLTINLNPGIIAVFGPVLVLLLLVGLSIENDVLLVARQSILDDISKLPSRAKRLHRGIDILFWVPMVAAIFLVVQYYNNVVPNDPIACDVDRKQQFFSSSHLAGTPSLYCIHNLTEGMPWIYPPFQIYAYLLVLAGCAVVTSRIARTWREGRSTPPRLALKDESSA